MKEDLLVFYSPGACSLSCMIALEWTKQPYLLCRVERDMRQTDAFKRINPQGKVPAARINGRFLTENSAILARIGYGHPTLLPLEGTIERDEANMWFSYLGSGFHASFYPYFRPQRYIKTDAHFDEVKDTAVEQIRQQLAFLDNHLSKSTYLLGDKLSLLDGYLYATSRWAKKFVDIPKEFSHLAAYQALLEKDPVIQFCLAIEEGKEAKSPSGLFKGHLDLGET